MLGQPRPSHIVLLALIGSGIHWLALAAWSLLPSLSQTLLRPTLPLACPTVLSPQQPLLQPLALPNALPAETNTGALGSGRPRTESWLGPSLAEWPCLSLSFLFRRVGVPIVPTLWGTCDDQQKRPDCAWSQAGMGPPVACVRKR